MSNISTNVPGTAVPPSSAPTGSGPRYVTFTKRDVTTIRNALARNRDAESFTVTLQSGETIDLVPGYAKYLLEYLS